MEKFIYHSTDGEREYIFAFTDEQFAKYGDPYCMSFFDGVSYWWPNSNLSLLIPIWQELSNFILLISRTRTDKIEMGDDYADLVHESTIRQYITTFGAEGIHQSIIDLLAGGPLTFRGYANHIRYVERHGDDIYGKEIRKAKKGYVYLVRSISGHYKIGRTKDINNRLYTFKSKLPFEVELTHSFECDDYIKAERELHEKYAHRRIDGEWFDLTEDEVSEITSIKYYPVKDAK